MSGNAVCTTAQAFIDRCESMASEYFGRRMLSWNGATDIYRSDTDATVSCWKRSHEIRNGQRRGDECDRGVRLHRHQALQLQAPHAAHVTVDPRTGAVDSVDSIAIEDISRMLNPLVVHGQALGAIVQGLGGTFLEHYATTRPDNCSPPRSPTTFCRPRPTSPTCVAISWSWRWRLETHSAPKARAKAALWRWLPQ